MLRQGWQRMTRLQKTRPRFRRVIESDGTGGLAGRSEAETQASAGNEQVCTCDQKPQVLATRGGRRVATVGIRRDVGYAHTSKGMVSPLGQVYILNMSICRSITLSWTQPLAVTGRPSFRNYEKECRAHVELLLQTFNVPGESGS
jgi:hypothetical protein